MTVQGFDYSNETISEMVGFFEGYEFFWRKDPFLRRKSQVEQKALNLLRKARNAKSIFSPLLNNLVTTAIQVSIIASIMANAIEKEER